MFDADPDFSSPASEGEAWVWARARARRGMLFCFLIEYIPVFHAEFKNDIGLFI